ncbi:MAG TPA: DUF1553 domain-containing protein [Candidatus Saccharimonadales bacterium]|nr:DUF1553 domain-containing protein [Candidatus Saccharimonadales bacterium]
MTCQLKKGLRLSVMSFALFFAVCRGGLAASESNRLATAHSLWVASPLTSPSLPQIRNKNWVRNSVDAFILSRLEAQGLTPAGPADKAALLRRVTLDLHGLPPTSKELDDFIADHSDLAFSRVVERLLASPRYGEVWGRHWLDLVRFGESHGYEYDKIRDHAWPYRDYVIESFNSDKPYSRFIQEQIAGDVLEPVTRQGIVATGMLVCSPWDEAGNSQVSAVMKARIREEELEDMVSVIGQTFLGLTVNCARCHDHKFDPIPQRDYYAVKAALSGVRHGNRSLWTPAEQQGQQQNSARLQQTITELEAQNTALLESAAKRVEARRDHSAVSEALRSRAPKPLATWTFETNANDQAGNLHAELKSGALLRNGRLILDGNGSYAETAPLQQALSEKTLEAWVTLATLEQSGGGVLSVENSQNGQVFDSIVFGEQEPKQWMAGSEFFKRTRSFGGPKETAKANELIHLALVYAADSSVTFYRDGQLYGKSYVPDAEKITTFPPGKSRILFGLRHHGAGNGFFRGEIEEARLYDRALTAEEIKASGATRPSPIGLDILVAALSEKEKEKYHETRRQIGQMQSQIKQAANAPLVFAANSKQPERTYVLRRGEVDKPKEEVTSGALSIVKALSSDFALRGDAPEGQRRLRLSQWLTNPENPLPPRVLVNRVWHYHFGRGIVATPNDFGANGEAPTHPELLDWLASEFMRGGGSIKALHRLILLSSTYQQASRNKHDASDVDAEDRLLWHFPLRRMEGEIVRDSMLWLSGNLNLQMGGPGFRPFTVFVNNSHFYTLTNRWEPEFNRRSVYRISVHSARDPLLDSLDCPDPSSKTPARAVTTTPIQSLGLMNSAFVQRQAADWSLRLKQEVGPDPVKQIQLARRLALARPASRDELSRALAFEKEHGLESLCWVLLNSSEFMYVQ